MIKVVNEKQCYKKFCKITDGKENEGYGEWKEWVLKQIESYDKKQLTNLEKRTEIKLKNKEADCNIKQQTISSYGIPVVCAMFSIIVTIIVSPMKNAEYNDMSRMIEFLYMNGVFFSLAIVIALIEIKRIENSSRKKYSWKLYFEELLKILEEKLVQMS